MKIKRADKIEYLSKLYMVKIVTNSIEEDASTLNQIIIDAMGISGLKMVKKKAWAMFENIKKMP